MLMSILEFINNNGVLVGFLGLFVAPTFSLIKDGKKERYEDIKTVKNQCEKLKQELAECKEKLKEYQSVEKAEAYIDKSMGSIYQECMPDGSTRNICGYCWEKEHIKIPLILKTYTSVFEGDTSKWYECRNCKAKHSINKVT